MENFRRHWNLAHITVTKTLKCFRTNGCGRWINRSKIEKFVALAEYFEQQTDCSKYRRKISESRRSVRGGNSGIYLSLSNKHATDPSTVSHVISERQWKSTFDFIENVSICGLKRGIVCQIVRLLNFLWNYTCNFENIF